MASPLSVLQVRINHVDHVLTEPGPFDNSNLYRVPVLRIYGVSSTGKKACVHVHQVYPYFFVEYAGVVDPSSVNNYIARLTRSLNHAIAISLKRNPESSSSQFIRAIFLVKGIHFYGFHSSYTPFLKIYFVDPACLNRAVTLLQSGVVMKTRFCVYESHISFPLQFMCDFGLYGCGWIDLGEVSKRGDDQENQELDHSFKISPHPIQSRMELEVDVVAFHILNRHLISARNLHHKLTIPAPPLPNEPLVLSVRELWEDERRRRQARGLNPTPDLPVDPSENSRGTGGEWVAEARWWDEIRRRIERERGKEDLLPGKGWEKWVPTTFESTDALWEDGHRAWRPPADDNESSDTDQPSSNPFSTPSSFDLENGPDDKAEELREDVDEGLLSSQQLMQLVDQDEDDWEKLTGGDVVFDNYGGDGEDPFTNEDGPLAADISPVNKRNALKKDPDTPTTHRIRSPLKRDKPSNDDWTNLSGSPAFRDPSATPTRAPYKPNSIPSGASSPPLIRRPKQIVPFALPISPTDRIILDTARESLRSSPPVAKGKTTEDIFDSSPNPSEIVTARSYDGGTSRPTKRRRVGFRSRSSIDFASPTSSWCNRSISFPRISHSANYTSSPHSPSHVTQNPQSYIYAHIPPSTSELLLTLDDFGIPNKIYQDPYYSNEADASERTKEYAGLLFFIQSGTGLSSLEEWDDGSGISNSTRGRSSSITIDITGISGWEYAGYPPSLREAQRWLRDHPDVAKKSPKTSSQIEGPTQANIYGLKTTPTGPSDSKTREKQGMTIFSLEVFAPSSPGRMPDAGTDEVTAAFYSFQGADDATTPDLYQTGVVIIGSEKLDPNRLRNFRAETVPNELELLNRIADIVVYLDPDIIVGWEIQSASWGYLDARGKHYGYDFEQVISRAPGKRRITGSDEWSARHTSTFSVIGRHVLNVWRIMRVEQNLETYTFENTVFHLLRQRVPRYTSDTLTTWYQSSHPVHTARVLKYMMDKTTMVLQMLDASETVTKTAEFARVFGVDFFSVISRGSQFKVESFMFRIAKPESFVLLSPSKQDVGTQNAAECMPLIMEPQSDFYNSPLVVLDFQSLYPSIMIAYNYCYSTCIGRVVDFMGKSKFGVTDLKQPPGLLETVKDHINVAPNGIIYVKPEVRKGLLGRMLQELLETRVMVKQAMKGVKGDKALRRVLDARQLGLKYISNVTYGYTSATFSGRMPAVEIADSIVQSGRETLEKAIGVIEATTKWGAQVVYGDTDSLFIYLPGKTKEQAFRIGYDISDTITAMNPAPIKLKFEKVYLPCVLLAKKRYVGFKYESPDDKEPDFDAKGIETVRRDGVLAQRKMTENCLKILFRSRDLSKVKEYCCASWSKILVNKAPIQDFIFAKEVRLGTYSDRVPPPPGAMVAARKKTIDLNSEPQHGDRIPYVITRGEPNSKLVDRAVAPDELFNDKRKQLDSVYYITRVLIPPLERIFNLVGADVRAWYDEMPRTVRVDQEDGSTSLSPKKTLVESAGPSGERPKINDHFRASQCLICTGTAYDGICGVCRADPQKTITALSSRVQRIEKRLQEIHSVCASCTGSANAEAIECVSLDCPWLFARKKAEDKSEFALYLRDMISGMEDLTTVDEGDNDEIQIFELD